MASRLDLLAQLALASVGDVPLEELFDSAVQGVAAIMGHEYCKVLELLPGGQEVKLVSGVGWQEGLVGVATVGTGMDSQAGYTLQAGEPVVVSDLRTEERFWGPPLLRDHGVISGISAVIPGRGGPWGVLGVHARQQRTYTADDPTFIAAVAATLGSAIARRGIESEVDRYQRQTARALRREEVRSAELRGIIAAMGDGVLVFDELGRLLLMNAAARAILGDRAPGTIGELGARFDLELATGTDHGLVERSLDGTSRWVELRTYGIGPRSAQRHGHESHASAIAVIRDVTEARAAREAREAFIEMLSHELRTPVTTIYGGAELLVRRPDHARRQEIAEDVRAEADRLRRIVENLVVLTKAERGALAPSMEPVSLAHVVPAIVEAEQRRSPDHTMRLDVDRQLPTVRGDTTYIEQIVRNFLANAAKFSPAGTAIDVLVEAGSEGALVSVSDGGPGFDPSEAEAIFGLFYRAKPSVAGSGVGLFVSRLLAESMGGSVAARRPAEGGARFELRLPSYAE